MNSSQSATAVSYADLEQLAQDAARAGGAVARAAFGRRQSIEKKADGSEVTQIDLDAQRAVIAAIRARRPNDVFIGEETLPENGAGPRDPAAVCWIIDPIDGTRNFVRGLPLFACSVAACVAGRPVAGAIFAPQLDEMYAAHEGGALVMNGRVVRPADRAGVVKTPVVAIPSNLIEPVRGMVVRALDKIVLRTLGTTALHMAWVAAGAYDGALNSDCKLWDIAAGVVLVRAVGGDCTGLTGQALFPMDLGAYRGQETPCISVRDSALRALFV